MSKLRATRAQVIAAAIIVVLAVVLGGVGCCTGHECARF